MVARKTTLVLPLLLLGLVITYTLALMPECALASPGEVRVVSQKNSTEDSQKKTSDKEPTSETVGPMDIFSDIERGWNTEKAELILQHFGQGKVTISIDGTGPSGGNFSRNQSYYLLNDMFKYTITRKFEIVQYRKPNDAGNTSFVVAERYYQKTDDGRLFKDKIYVSLHLEPAKSGTANSRWVVDEIKSIR
jgi:hypothetical protein